MKRTDSLFSCYRYFLFFFLFVSMSVRYGYSADGKSPVDERKIVKPVSKVSDPDNSATLSKGTISPLEMTSVMAGEVCPVLGGTPVPLTFLGGLDENISSETITLPFPFKFFGQDVSIVKININGNITFDQGARTFNSGGFPITSGMVKMIAPFYADVDLNNGGGNVTYILNPDYLVVTWNNVGFYHGIGPNVTPPGVNYKNTFSVILARAGTGVLPGGANVAFSYGSMNWTSGDNNGVASYGFGLIPATVGFNAGDDVNSKVYGLFNQNSSSYDGAKGNNDGVKHLEGKCLLFDIRNSLTAEPGLCNSADNKFDLSGTAFLTNPPTSGTLRVSDDVSGISKDYPVTASGFSPLYYTVPGIPSDGRDHQVTATFLNTNIPPLTQTYRAPHACYTQCAYNKDATFTQLTFSDLDDGSAELDLGFDFNFNGTNYRKVYVNVNGTITVEFPMSGASYPDAYPFEGFMVINPFWADIDLNRGGTISYKRYVDKMIIAWDQVGYNFQPAGNTKKNSFQVVLTKTGSTYTVDGSNVLIYYNQMNWACGSSNDQSGFGGTPSKAGINLGDGRGVLIGEFSSAGSRFVTGATDNGIDYLDGKCYSFKVYRTIVATPSACSAANNNFNLTGKLYMYQQPVTTGTLTITDNISGKFVVLNPPFNSPVDFTISDIPSDGATHTVSAVFSTNALQNTSATYSAPAACYCAYFGPVWITQSLPVNLKVLGSGDSKSLKYVFSQIPTVATHQVTIQIMPEKISPEGIVVPDYSAAYQVVKNYNSTTPLATTTTVNFTEFTTMPATGKFYWRVGYANSNNSTIQWSDVSRFSIPEAEPVMPLESHVKSNTTHTNAINWQYETTFLDNNQTQQSIVYMDGLGNVRQTQALANSVKSGTNDGNVLCKENVYSENGGSPVQSLTSPLHSNKFKYEHRFFDVGSGTTIRDFSTEDFDMDAIAAGAKDRMTPPALEVSSANNKGVGYYYSNSNTFETQVDNAEGYPYSYTVSQRNPSGKTEFAGGFGKDFRISSGRETQVVESKAAPEELEKVFGKNAPPAENIVKTTIYDANGVGSISYSDSEGKVIATALTACRSENLQGLNEPGATPITTVTDVLKNENSNLGDVSKTARGQFEISCFNGTATLDYSLDLKTFPGYDSQCKACKYNIDIKVIEDRTGKVVYPAGGASSVVTIGAADIACGYSNAGYKILSGIQLTGLNPGTYSVVRNISPAFETTAGATESYLEKIEEEFIEHIETHKDQYYNDYLAEINPDKYFLLRKIETGINRNTTDCSEIAATATLSVGAQSGDEFSPELIKNGNFTGNTTGLWKIPTFIHPEPSVPAAIISGKLKVVKNTAYNTFSNTGAALYTNPVIRPGKLYKLEFDVVLNSQSLIIRAGNGYFGDQTAVASVTASGHYSYEVKLYYDDYTENYLGFWSDDALLDNISLKEIKTSPCGVSSAPNLVKNGTLGAGTKGWYSMNAEVNITTSVLPVDKYYAKTVYTNLTGMVSGKKYQLEFDLLERKGYNSLRVFGGGFDKTITSTGRQVFVFTATSDNSINFAPQGLVNTSPEFMVWVDNIEIHEIRPCSLKVFQNGTAVTAAVPYNLNDVQTATDLVTALGTSNANFAFSNMSGLSPKIAVKGKSGIGSSGNDVKFELRASTNGTIYDIILDDDITAGGINNLVCKERLWYTDEIILKDLDPVVVIGNSTYKKQITDAAGDKNNNGVEGDEKYYLTGELANPPFEPESKASETAYYKKIFIDTYEKQHWYKYPESDLTTFEVYKAPAGSELGSTIAVLAEDKKLLTETDSYFIIKIKAKQPSCEANCQARNDDSDCATSCDEMQKYYDADFTRAKAAVDNFTAANPGNKYNGKTLSAVITGEYPITSNDTRAAIYDDATAKQLFIEFEVAYQAKAAFSKSTCISVCLNPKPDKCGTCDVDYYQCVKGNFDEISKGHQYVYDQWADGQAFPITKSMLTVDGEINSEQQNNLGALLYDHLVATLPESGSPTWTKTDWEAMVTVSSSNCTNCLSPASNGCTQRAFTGSDLPQSLFSVFTTSNASCLTPYQDCIKKSDPATLENEQCQEDIDKCTLTDEEFRAHPKYVTDAASPCYQKLFINNTCITKDQYNADCQANFSCANHMKQQKLALIDQTVVNLYKDKETALAKKDEIFKEYEFRPIQELALYLLQLDDYESCRQSCENGRDRDFLKWYELKKQKVSTTVRDNYINTCFGGAAEKFTVTTTKELYHFTLYNFNKANELTGTVPPEGIDYVDKTKDPVHRLATVYKVNTLGQLQTHTTPEEGTTGYLYDKAGRIRFSQSAEQSSRLAGYMIFSYTKYDESGRLVETGECRHKILSGNTDVKAFLRPPAYAPVPFVSDYVNDNSFPSAASENFEVNTYKFDASDLVNGVTQGIYQHGRVSSVRNENANTFYNYDAHGRVNWVVQELKGMSSGSFKKMEYEYEPVTSRVITMHYQKGVSGEQLSHTFEYDKDNRVKVVKISRNGTDWYIAATYDYYMHGPLKNIVYGDNVQKIDYVYNIQGWLKAINNPFQLTETGKPKDVFAEVLHYYSGYKDQSGTYQTVGDYKRSSTGFEVTAVSNTFKTTPQESATTTNTWMRTSGSKKVYDLYNGNISSIVTSTGFALAGQSIDNLMLQGYRYDVLNRLVESFTETQNTITASFAGFSKTAQVDGTDNYYREKMTYDANGNIMSLKRTTGPSGAPAMDNMSYAYPLDVNGNKINNKLLHVTDTDGDIAVVEGDIVGRTSTCVETPVPASSKWAIRNTRNDQNNGASFTNETDVLLFTQPSGNLNTAWLIDQEKPIKIESGKIYTVVYEFLGDATSITKMKVGLASSIGTTAPVLLTGTSEITSGFSSAYYKTHRFTVTATGTGTAYLAVELTWSGTAATPSLVTTTVKNKLKNVNVCGPGVTIGVISATNYSLGNTNSDQTTGSSLVATGDELRVTHKSGGMNYIWLMDKTSMTVKKGEGYTIIAEVKDFDAVRTANMTMNLATATAATGPTLLTGQPDVFISRTYNSTGFTKVTFSFVAEADATVYPVFKLNYGTTSPAQTTYTWFRKFTREGYGLNNCNGNNFTYDAKGRMIADCENEIAVIRWTQSDKVSEILRSSGSAKPNLKFTYDGLYRKICKEVIYPSQPANNTKTFYVYDASGELISTYGSTGTGLLSVGEQIIYGSDRIGNLDRSVIASGTELQIVSSMVEFEVSDHLNNVRAVVKGIKKVDGEADIVFLADYYPFGMMARSFSSNNYRYGFNGKEKDKEIKSEGNSYDFGARIFDPRIARFLSLDPRAIDFPFMTPYCYAGNSPIAFTDENGEGPIKAQRFHNTGKVIIVLVQSNADMDLSLITVSNYDYVISSSIEEAVGLVEEHYSKEGAKPITDLGILTHGDGALSLVFQDEYNGKKNQYMVDGGDFTASKEGSKQRTGVDIIKVLGTYLSKDAKVLFSACGVGNSEALNKALYDALGGGNKKVYTNSDMTTSGAAGKHVKPRIGVHLTAKKYLHYGWNGTSDKGPIKLGPKTKVKLTKFNGIQVTRPKEDRPKGKKPGSYMNSNYKKKHEF